MSGVFGDSVVSCSLIEFLSHAGLLVWFLAVLYDHHEMVLPLHTAAGKGLGRNTYRSGGRWVQGLRSSHVGAIALGCLTAFLIWRAFFRTPGEIGWGSHRTRQAISLCPCGLDALGIE